MDNIQKRRTHEISQWSWSVVCGSACFNGKNMAIAALCDLYSRGNSINIVMPSHSAGKRVTFSKWDTSLFKLPSILQVISPSLCLSTCGSHPNTMLWEIICCNKSPLQIIIQSFVSKNTRTAVKRGEICLQREHRDVNGWGRSSGKRKRGV